MTDKFKEIPLQKLIDEFNLEGIYLPMDAAQIYIEETDVNRPGLQLMSFMSILIRREFKLSAKWNLHILQPLKKI